MRNNADKDGRSMFLRNDDNHLQHGVTDFYRAINRINVETNANVSKTSSVSIIRVSLRNTKLADFYTSRSLQCPLRISALYD
jgi:hypothetical protein